MYFFVRTPWWSQAAEKVSFHSQRSHLFLIFLGFCYVCFGSTRKWASRFLKRNQSNFIVLENITQFTLQFHNFDRKPFNPLPCWEISKCATFVWNLLVNESMNQVRTRIAETMVV